MLGKKLQKIDKYLPFTKNLDELFAIIRKSLMKSDSNGIYLFSKSEKKIFEQVLKKYFNKNFKKIFQYLEMIS